MKIRYTGNEISLQQWQYKFIDEKTAQAVESLVRAFYDVIQNAV